MSRNIDDMRKINRKSEVGSRKWKDRKPSVVSRQLLTTYGLRLTAIILLTTYHLPLTTSGLYAKPHHTITVDGDLSDWFGDEVLIDDAPDLSEWKNNEINKIYLTWDSNNLYIGIDGSSRDTGLLVYFDFQSGGYSDLTKINSWNRKIIFQNNGIDYFYGSWSGSDGNFYVIQSSVQVSDVSVSKKSSSGRWELAIPFDTVYKQGAGRVPAGCSISLFASLSTGDMGSELVGENWVGYGYLGGDCAPNNDFTGLTASTVTQLTAAIIDSDYDGLPDNNYAAVELRLFDVDVSPNPFSPDGSGFCDETSLTFSLSKPASVKITVYDISGRYVTDIAEEEIADVSAKITRTWNGRNDSAKVVPGGIYFFNIQATTDDKSVKKNKAVAVIK